MKISLSVDGGHTYPYVLAASTANDGSESVIVPNAPTKNARIKVEAIGNVYFDISNADFSITIPGIVGLDSLGFSGTNSIDSYNSAAGPYGGTNKGNNASVFSNGSATLGGTQVGGTVRSATSNVVLGSGGLITGDVRAGTTITNSGTILGTKTPNSPSPTLNPNAVAACSPYTSATAIGGCDELQRRDRRPRDRPRQDGDAVGRHVLLPQRHAHRHRRAQRRAARSSWS